MIENTSERDPLIHVGGALSEGASGYIENMEAQGQRELVNSDRLPTRILHCTQEEFEALGFTFGEPDPHDDMFRPATLPEGWRREGSDHAMWSYIVDTNGRQRVAIFYKAAFYDRSAHMSLRTIYAELSELIWGDDKNPTPLVDDWTTREAWIEAINVARAKEADDATRWDEYGHADLARDSREKIAKYDALLVRLGVGGSDGE